MTKKSAIFILLLLSCLPARAGQVSFRHLGTAEGLSHGTVLSIVQDHQGKMWFATHDGLNCYDGYKFSVYRHVQEDSRSLAYNYVRTLLVDSESVLWISDGSCVSRYDSGTDGFFNYESPRSRNVMALDEFSADALLVAFSNSLWTFDKHSGEFSDSRIPDGIKKVQARSFAKDGQLLYIGTAAGDLYSWDLAGGDIRRFSLQGNTAMVRCILPHNGQIWVGTDGNGLFRLDPLTAETVRYGVEDGLVSVHIRALCLDSAQKIWIGTYCGLDIYDGSSFTHCLWSASDGVSLSNNSIRSLACDSQGGLWVGTYYGAISYSHPLRPEFTHTVPAVPGHEFPDNRISFIAQISEDEVLLANGYSGAMRYDLQTGKSSYIKIPGGEQGTNDIKAIFADTANSRIWFGGNFGGLSVMNAASGVMRHYDSLPSGVYCITPKDAGTLYVCTSSGLYTVDRRSGAARPEGNFDPKLKVRVISKDSKGRVWAGGAFGIRLFADDTSYEDITTPELDGISRVSCLLETSAGQQFIGTDYGLYSFSKDGVLSFFSTHDGLPNNVICSVSEDAFGLVWISTDNGICRFNPFTGAFRSYGPRDGLLFPRFIANSACLLSDGRLLLGSSEGLVSFVPESIKDDPFSPEPVIWKVKAAGSLLTPSEKGVELCLGNDPLIITFSTMNYLSGGRDRFKYRLRGYERKWHHVIAENEAEYLNLPAGRYVFELMAANDEGVWNNSMVKLPVSVRREWLHSPAAHIILVLLVLAISVFVTVLLLRRRREPGPEPEPEKELTPEEAFLRKAEEIVDANLANDGFSVTDIARELGISRSGLYVRMKQVTGVSVLEFIRRRRFGKACELLGEGRLTVAEVGYAVGFGSPTYFSRAFKKYYGSLPTEYINKSKNTKK
ncbi:MAG: helix-turn-helix domain-containing protein [Bacteroidales bacterium]|nr:helix-turn-helix domain-containing protein [Bacteroidales bacterium]